MWENISLIPNDLALFFLGICLVMPIIPVIFNQSLHKNRTFQVWLFWAFFFGMFSWLWMAIIGYVKYGLSGLSIPLLVAVIMGYDAYKSNKNIKTILKK
jgi:hypothetical protein